MRKVVLFGGTLVVSTIGASLQGRSDLHLVQMEAFLPDALQRLDAACPDVILFDLASAQPDFAVPLLRKRPGLLMIGVDLVGQKMLVLSGEQSRLLTTEDLLQVIRDGIQSKDNPGAQ